MRSGQKIWRFVLKKLEESYRDYCLRKKLLLQFGQLILSRGLYTFILWWQFPQTIKAGFLKRSMTLVMKFLEEVTSHFKIKIIAMSRNKLYKSKNIVQSQAGIGIANGTGIIILFYKFVYGHAKCFSNLQKCRNLNIFFLAIEDLLERVLRNSCFVSQFLNRRFAVFIDVLGDSFN